MRSAAYLAALLALSGCAVFRQTPPPLVRPGPGPTAAGPSASPGAPSTGAGPAATASPAGSTSTPPAQAVAPPPTPISVPTPSSTPTGPPAAPTPTPTPAPSPDGPPPASSPPLIASLSPVETRRLQDEAQRRIEDAERLLRQLEGRPFPPKELETLRLAQSLVEQARKALGGEEYERAANLAAKARTLAEDLSSRR